MLSFVYSLRTYKDRPILDYGLGLKVVEETPAEIKINLSGEIVTTIKKAEYLNYPGTRKFRVYDTGSIFFLICSKGVNSDYAFKVLLDYACSKIETRISHLETLKSSYKRLVAA
ncbi:MAG: hypothetical protein P4L31_07670 [Candidatus Babeliales bacterium]|nr:hypothetical protein [Candidatus Babeliales bacterium]